MNELARRLKHLRTERGWSQYQLADKARVSQQLIWKIETGQVLETRKLPRIAAAFRMTVDELISGSKATEDSPPPPPPELTEAELNQVWREYPTDVKRTVVELLQLAQDLREKRRADSSIIQTPDPPGAQSLRSRRDPRRRAAK